MSKLDDLPKRDKNRKLQEQSETTFRAAISEGQQFVVQKELDSYDYGSDFQIEVIEAGVMTNVRIHVQLKGTESKRNSKGYVAVSIKRINLNYLAMNSGSIFVCFHAPTSQLLVRRVDDVICEYEHSSKNWTDQSTVTVNLSEAFDKRYQENLKNYALACAKDAKDYRIEFATLPPEKLISHLDEGAVDLPIPADPEQAEELLVELYQLGRDSTISHSYDKFRAILTPSNEQFMFAYMAEINLGVNGKKCDKARIAEGLELMRKALNDSNDSNGSMLYSSGNGWLALGEYEKARDTYFSALEFLVKNDQSQIAAQCYKNLGEAMEKLHSRGEAYDFYAQALELDPLLAEAHYALALWHIQEDVDLDCALEHLDAIVWPVDSAGRPPTVHAWRADIMFRQEKTTEAFRDIRALLGSGEEFPWAWPWCARLVATHGNMSLDAALGAVQFWDDYLEKFPDHIRAERERLLCIWRIHANGGRPSCDYDGFKEAVAHAVTQGAPDPAFLWDRAGHWAQDQKNWSEAEKCYRKAFDLSPAEYGYCLGTALNFLGRYDEALPILLEQAQEHLPDAKSWFQVAIARENTGDVEGSINVYDRVLQLDENYDLAWFNLGGVYWNSGNQAKGQAIWFEAMRRFPDHALSRKLRRQFSEVPGNGK